jgi:D-alanyl-D-alanine carboxypeptidase/D-alanyl-D-alanine-endopeptidase (penicillin-binding protein 4)
VSRRLLVATLSVAGSCVLAIDAAGPDVASPVPNLSQQTPLRRELVQDLDRIFDDPALARALVAARVESLGHGGRGPDGVVLYDRNAQQLVVPASNMKILTVAAAADTLGWDYRYETRLEALGPVSDGVLRGDLVVTGTGDPSIGSPDGSHGPIFLDWARALDHAGIRRIDGRLIGDDTAFDDEGRGAGWAWDFLSAGYAAPVGALVYNESAAVARVTPGSTAGSAARVDVGPPGHALDVRSDVVTGPPGSVADISVARMPGNPTLALRGRVPAGGAAVDETVAVENPTTFFVEGLRLALSSRGVAVTGGAWDVDDVSPAPAGGARRTIAVHVSAPLSVLAGHAMKASRNLYAESFLKTIGRVAGNTGSTAAGREVVQRTLSGWGIPLDAVVMYDGSGLSRYNYLTASAIVSVLRHAWRSERLRGPFVAALPVGGRDGTLDIRMRGTSLDRNVQAKTGTLSNVRALSGYLETADGEKLVFSIIANHFTAATSAVDGVVERALERLVGGK